MLKILKIFVVPRIFFVTPSYEERSKLSSPGFMFLVSLRILIIENFAYSNSSELLETSKLLRYYPYQVEIIIYLKKYKGRSIKSS